MKLVLTLLCLALSGAVATPFYGATDEENQPLNAIYQEESLFNGAIDQEESLFNDAFYQEDLTSDNAIQQDEQESDTNQDMGQDDEEEQPTADVQLFHPRVVVQGSTIALQTYDKRTWLSCSTHNCKKQTCPLLYMDPHDWTRCWGEVFQIYRQKGKGAICVGDVVGLHYPREHGKWFSLAGGHGHKESCPGNPNLSAGFANKYKWFQCWGEVFKIFARGYDGTLKSHGEVIKEHDIIMLCYIRQNKFVGFHNVANLQTCPGTALPPPANKYDRCWGEVAKVWLR